MKLLFPGVALAVVSLYAAASTTLAADTLVRVPNPSWPGTAWAVRVPDGPLLVTDQIVATDLSRDARGQAEQIIDQLGGILAKAGGDLQHVVKLDVYAASDAAVAALDAALGARFKDAPPAVTLMITSLPRAGALVGCAAVASIGRAPTSVQVLDNAAAVPAGGKVFVSGQAKRAPDFGASIAETMQGLHQALAYLGLAKTSVVQVKAFIAPFRSHATARAEIEKSYAGGPIPPIIVTEWTADGPTEIELIASAPTLAAKGGEAAAFLALPGMTTSPYFSRVATVAAGSPLIFIAGLDGGEATNPREQWFEVFHRLAFALRESGSTFRHLVKATYFLAHPKAREALGEIRGVYYEPTRPPAASAIEVHSIGRPGRQVALDMIAVPAKLPPPPAAPGKAP